MLKVGFLLPRSNIYPLIAHDFIDGCKSYLSEFDLLDKIEISTANIGFGVNEAEVYAMNEKLLMTDGVDMVVAFTDGRSATLLQPLFAATGKILFQVNMGAIFGFGASDAPTTFTHSFNAGFNIGLTGKLAADEGHREAIKTTSYYDGGYLLSYSLVNSYLNNGGTIIKNIVSSLKIKEFNIADLEAFLDENNNADTVFCSYCAEEAVMVFNELSRVQQKRNVNLYVSPMMLDDSLKKDLGDDLTLQNVSGFTAWNPALDNPFNNTFKNKFRKYSGREPGIFSLLGWETGTILEQVYNLSTEGTIGKQAVTALMKMKLNSPRGWIAFDEESRQSFSPSYLVSVADGFSTKVERTLEDTVEARKLFYTSAPETESSGWNNIYPCI